MYHQAPCARVRPFLQYATLWGRYALHDSPLRPLPDFETERLPHEPTTTG